MYIVTSAPYAPHCFTNLPTGQIPPPKKYNLPLMKMLNHLNIVLDYKIIQSMWLYILSFATPARSMPYTEGPTKSGLAAVNHRWAWRFWSSEYFVDRYAELKIDVAVCVMPMIDLRHCGNQHDYFISWFHFICSEINLQTVWFDRRIRDESITTTDPALLVYEITLQDWWRLVGIRTNLRSTRHHNLQHSMWIRFITILFAKQCPRMREFLVLKVIIVV